MRPAAARRMDGIERTLIRQIFDSAPKDAVNLGLGQPDLPTPESIAAAGIRAIRDGWTAYTSTAGDPELRAAIAARYAPFARGADSVVVTVGTQEAVFASLLVLLDPGDEALVPDPGYPAYATIVRLLGARAVPYRLGAERGFRPDPAEIEARLTARTRVVVLCSPSNPTGAVAGAAELGAIVGLLAERGIAWLSDEIYAAFTYDAPAPSPSTLAPEGGLVISGLSKDLSMTGWRVGWVVGPVDVVRRIVAAHQYLVTCAPSISQRAAVAALGTAGEAARRTHREVFRRRRALMATELARVPGLRFSLPDGAFYFFVGIEGRDDSLALSREILAEANVVTIPGIAFGSNGEGYLRLSYAATEEDIVRGVRGIARVLTKR